jgi:hypothetical protein
LVIRLLRQRAAMTDSELVNAVLLPQIRYSLSPFKATIGGY